MKPRGPDGRFVKVTDKRSGAMVQVPLTAAAATIPSREIDRMPRAAEGWQERAWRLWQVLGVLHYPTSFMAEQVQRISWNVAVNGEELDPEAAARSMEAVTTPLGLGEVSRLLALNLEVAGEVFYYRKADAWNVLATTVTKRQEILRGADIIVRSWMRDPVDTDKPDSPVRAALDVAEEIRVMAALSRAQSRSRVGRTGILLVPKEGQFPEGDDFQANLEEHLTAPTSDEYSASAISPLKVDFPAEYIEKWRHLVLDSPYDDKLQEKIDNAIKRLALSLNMPPEVLLGNMDSSHWNAWLSEESTYRAHVEPLAMLVGQVYAKAMMDAVDGAVEIVVTPDPSELLARRQSVADSFRALELCVVGFEYVRRQIGADEEDAPTDDEIALILAAQGQVPPGTVPAVGTGQVDTGAPALPSNGNGQQPAIAAAAGIGDDPELDRLGRSLAAIDTQLLGTLRGLAAMAIEGARSKRDDDESIAQEVARMGRAWSRSVDEARGALGHLGVDASGPPWDQAQEQSVARLVDGIGIFVRETAERSDSDMPAIPTDLLREVLATAGGSATATIAALPAPTFKDPQGFAIGVLSLKNLKDDGVELVQWRFRYGPLTRSEPFPEHKAADGQFMTHDGHTKLGYYPGDHKGCECGSDPVLRRVKQPQEV